MELITKKLTKKNIEEWRRRFALVIIALFLQLGFWQYAKGIQPDMSVVPDVPSKQTLKALTFGDDEFYFRMMAFNLQNAGDTFGRFTSLRYYDFHKLYLWFRLLDTLDNKSNMLPSMATYYFAQTQNTQDVRYMVDYLYEHSLHDVPRKWWWLLQSIYLAMHRLDDKDLALKVAGPLQNEKVPVWARQMTAVVYEKRGEMEDALRIMQTIKDNVKDIPESDLNFMAYFVQERLGKLEESKNFGVWPPPRKKAK